MKRWIAFLLALILMFSTAVSAFAVETDPVPEEGTSVTDPQETTEPAEPEVEPEQTEAAPETPEEPEDIPGDFIDLELPAAPEEDPETTETTPKETPTDIGQVDVSIGAGLALEKQVEFTITLSNGTNPQTKTFLLGKATDGNDPNVRTKFEGLKNGKYTLTVEASGFATYTQEIEVADNGTLVQIMTGVLAGFNYASGTSHPGVLVIGDVDGNHKVEKADAAPIIEAMEKETTDATDLNGDGKTNLVDLEYLAKGLAAQAGGKDTLAVKEHFVPVAAVTPSVSKQTEIVGDGSLEALLKDEKPVQLKPAGENTQISVETPVEVDFAMPEDGMQTDGIVIEAADSNPISDGLIDVTYVDAEGVEHTVVGRIGGIRTVSNVHLYGVNFQQITDQKGEVHTIGLPAAAPLTADPMEDETPQEETEYVTVTQDANGNITVSLGSQVAVKKVTLTITGMKNDNNLAEISRVEFVNGMGDRIPEPQMDIPQNLQAKPGSKEFTVTWTPCVNITGYEVVVRQGNIQETTVVTNPTLTVSGFNNDKIKNYTTFTVQVRSVNGTWYSEFSNAIEVTPLPSGKPDKPDMVKSEGGFEQVKVSWKDMEDTRTYTVYYREKGAADSEEKSVKDIAGTSYTIDGLKDETTYVIYVTGTNEFGESDRSNETSATTTSLVAAEMPQYNLINRDEEGNPSTDHIKEAIRGGGGTMYNSPRDDAETTKNTAWGTVDGDPKSYYFRGTWDDGGHWNVGNVGLTYTFEEPHKMDTIGILPSADMNYFYAHIRWWDENNVQHDDWANYGTNVTLQSRQDDQKRPYYWILLPEPITATKIQIGLARYWNGADWQRLSVADVYFYEYDAMKEKVMALYADDLHVTLRENVDKNVLDALETEINESKDEFGNENPNKALLLRELENARKIYEEGAYTGRITKVHNQIITNETNLGFTGLNAWQPLGVVAAAGDTVTIYVGHPYKNAGDATDLQLVATQYHAEADAMDKVVCDLRVGANEVPIPKIWKTSGMESGGALYVQYKGRADAKYEYAVRVSGGTEVPMLDLYKVTDEQERLSRAKDYIEDLETYTAKMEALHNQIHLGSDNDEVNYDYKETTCILGATDILLDTMMLSIPAKQALAGATGKEGNPTTEEKAKTLLASAKAMEDMMYLFYQHKGLNSNAKDAINRIPSRHLNIRYQQMFSGAFMYASGNHIGIEYPETAGMTSCGGVVVDKDGKYVSGNYFGWGIAHEIGHDINQGSYAVAEVTNNYFAVLAQAQDNNDSVRFKYENVYEKVTSGTKGSASNVFTQLGMYWQLHLAYDTGYNFKTYEDHQTQLDNLFFARVDRYARTPANAPKPQDVALTLTNADKDQTLMRLACAAAEKNILDFFVRWGKTPDAGTVAYASQFPVETRAIYYVNDDARAYTIAHHGTSALGTTGDVEAMSGVSVAVDKNAANKVNLTITPNETVPTDEILGYEIIRCTISGGQVEERTVGFTTTSTFSDVVTALNNRAVFYRVTMVDVYLNRSAVVETDMVKIEHKGNLDKSNWTVLTNDALTALDPVIPEAGDEMPCEPKPEDATLRMLDNDVETAYRATVTGNATITVEFNQTQVITGFIYTAGASDPITDYVVDVRINGEWVKLSEGNLGETKTVYFSNSDGKYVSTYEADALRLSLTTQHEGTISIAELDVLGVTGDNVDFRRADNTGTTVIGILSEDYQFGTEEGQYIPKGSLVFAGSYKGNPAYNVVLLYDQDGNIVGGIDETTGALKAYQIILANVPEEGKLQDVYDGTWIYWLEPGEWENMDLPTKVRAELYRVNDALTNAGQRLVSDSLFEAVPSTLPEVTLKKN